MNIWHARTILLFGLAACVPADEQPSGSDTVVFTEPSDQILAPETPAALDGGADVDGDGLTDDRERALGTNPEDADSDGDGYRDGDEVLAGADPLDAASVIYEGGWPYNPDKHLIATPEAEVPVVGDVFPRFSGVDQYGDVVDVYDFLAEDTYVVVVVMGAWCRPCQMVAEFLQGEENQVAEMFPRTREHLASGRVRLVEFMVEGPNMDQAMEEDIEAWHEAYPETGIPIMLDLNQEIEAFASTGYLPTEFLLDSDGRILTMSQAIAEPPPFFWLEENL